MKHFAAWLLAVVLLAQPGCAYKFKESGHRDLDRSVRFCDDCCAVAAIGAIGAGLGAAFLWLWANDDDGMTFGDSDSQYQPPAS